MDMIGKKVVRKGMEGVVVGVNGYMDIDFGGGIVKSFSMESKYSTGLVFVDPEAAAEYALLQKKADIRACVRETEEKLARYSRKAGEVISSVLKIGGMNLEELEGIREIVRGYAEADKKCAEAVKKSEKIGSVSAAGRLLQQVKTLQENAKATLDKVEEARKTVTAYANTPAGKAAAKKGHAGRIAMEVFLEQGVPYGDVIPDVYFQAAESFGWCPENYKKRGCLEDPWIEKTTPEGYSVWFIVHSNLSDGRPSAEGYYNEIANDTITEYWPEAKDKAREKDEGGTRVVFAKDDRTGGYVFLGVYRFDPSDLDLPNHKRVHRLICSRYPENPLPEHTTMAQERFLELCGLFT